MAFTQKADDIRCSFSAYSPNISCSARNERYPRENYSLTLADCKKDIEQHLRSLKLAVGDIRDLTEADLICRRVGLFVTNHSLTVCPAHRFGLGIDFRQRNMCKHPNHTGKGKVFRGLSAQHSMFLIQNCGVLVPVGSGVCYKCYRQLSTESKPAPVYSMQSKGKEDVYTDKGIKKQTAEQEDQVNPTFQDSYEEVFNEDIMNFYGDDHEPFIESDVASRPSTVDSDYQPDCFNDSEVSSQSKPNSQPNADDFDSQTISLASSQISSWTDEDKQDDIPLGKINEALSVISNGSLSPLKFKVRRDISDLQPSSKRLLKRKATSAIEALLDCFAPGQATKLMEMINLKERHEDTKPPDLKSTIVKLYMDTNDCNMKRQMLSLLVKDHTKKQLQQMIPGLTIYSIDQARLHASVYGEGITVPKPSKHYRQRLDQGKLAHALDFFFSPLFHQVSSYGTKEMKLQNGEKVSIPEVVRTVCHANLVLMYEAFCKETDVVPLSRSSLFEILKVSSASKRASLKGLDNIAADGTTAFDTLDQVIKQLKPYLTDCEIQDKIEMLGKDLHACRLYLKTDFKLHISPNDHCPDHCISFALSDPVDAKLRVECSHQHDMKCDRCELFVESLTSLKMMIAHKDVPLELQSELMNDIEVSEAYVLAWRQHLIRSSNQDRSRTDLLENLKPHEVFIIMDWAMKFLPLSFREKQSEWYGQKGINWHICVCIFKDQDQNLKHRTYAHIFDHVKQDWFAVISVLEHTLKALKRQVPNITSAYLRSDNAGCYHCGNTWLSLEGISSRTEITIQRYDFSESQDGKSYCDAKIAHLRGKMRQYVSTGHDVRTALEMKEAVDALGGVIGCQAAYVEINTEKSTEACSKKNIWRGITKISNIQLREKEIIAWKAYNIGSGNVLTEEHLKKMCPSPVSSTDLIIHEDFIVPVKSEGTIKFEKEDVATNSSDHQIPCEISQQEDQIPSGYFSCVEPGCSRVFLTYGGLEAHILSGNHKMTLNKMSSFDNIRLQWKDSCHKIAEHSLLSRDAPVMRGTSSSLTGWALKKDRKSPRFGDKVTTYLKGIFEAGETTGRKATPQDVSKNMRVCRSDDGGKMFRPHECLQPSQIASYFSRLSVLSHGPRQQIIEDEDLDSVLNMIDTIEAINVVNDQ